MIETITLKDVKGRTCVFNPRNVVAIERYRKAKGLFVVRLASGIWIKIGAAEKERLVKSMTLTSQIAK